MPASSECHSRPPTEAYATPQAYFQARHVGHMDYRDAYSEKSMRGVVMAYTSSEDDHDDAGESSSGPGRQPARWSAGGAPFTHFSTGQLALARQRREQTAEATFALVTRQKQMQETCDRYRSAVESTLHLLPVTQAAMMKFCLTPYFHQLSLSDRLVVHHVLGDEAAAQAFYTAEGHDLQELCRIFLAREKPLRKQFYRLFKENRFKRN